MVRIEKARNSLVTQLDKEVIKRLETVDEKENDINSACLALSPVLYNIQQMMEENMVMDKEKIASYEKSGLKEKVLALLEEGKSQKDGNNYLNFLPS